MKNIERKIICVENVRNRIPGILPYYAFEGSGDTEYRTGISYITKCDNIGNFGEYVCDLINNDRRVRYIDIIEAYRFMKDKIDNGVRIERIGNTWYCKREDESCYGGAKCEPYENTRFIKTYDETYFNIGKYEYVPVDVNDFTQNNDFYDAKSGYSGNYYTLIEDYVQYDAYQKRYGTLKQMEKYYFNFIHIPTKSESGITGMMVPDYIYTVNFDDFKNYIESLSKNEDLEKFKQYGGKKMLEFLRNININWYNEEDTFTIPQGVQISGNYNFVAPFMDVDLFLNTQTKSVGVMDVTEFNVDESGYTVDIPEKYTHRLGIYDYINDALLQKHRVSGTTVESKLITLRENNYIYSDDMSEPLNGIFSGLTNDYSPKFYKIVNKVFTEVSGEELKVGDGMSNDAIKNTDYYRVTTNPNTALNTISGYEQYYFYFLIKYGNKIILPYKENKAFNYQKISGNTYTGNFITSISSVTEDDTVKFDYVLWGVYTSNDSGKTVSDYNKEEGIFYTETHNIIKKNMDIIIDGVPINVDDVLFEDEGNVKAYSKTLDLYRTVTLSDIDEMTVNEYYSASTTTNRPVYKDNTKDWMMEEPNITLNLTFERGTATAFESHFKLFECNTYNDLLNYGNNFFNLTE